MTAPRRQAARHVSNPAIRGRRCRTLLLLLACGLAAGACTGSDGSTLPEQPRTPVPSTPTAQEPATPPTEAPATAERAVATLPDAPTNGPLRVGANGRYFEDADGQATLLVGSHTWMSLQDVPLADEAFDFTGYLDFLVQNNHNFFRLWHFEQGWGMSSIGNDATVTPTVYVRTGPGTASDGGPRFDLTQFNPEYFDRLYERVVAARDRGIYVAVMLFNGWSLDPKGYEAGNPCRGHPFHGANNVNGIDVSSSADEFCNDAHRLGDARVTEQQERYVDKVIETVGGLDNVLFEISNESAVGTAEWQYHMVRYIKEAQSGLPLQHPVGMTPEFPEGDNAILFDGPADYVSPDGDGGYLDFPPPATGGQVSIVDTDHLWGIGGERWWLWTTITRGHNAIYMDCYNVTRDACGSNPVLEFSDDLRANMGYARTLLERTNLASLEPQPDVASTGFALASTDPTAAEYVVFVPRTETLTLDTGSAGGILNIEWLRPDTGEIFAADSVPAGGLLSLTPPFEGDAVLHAYA